MHKATRIEATNSGRQPSCASTTTGWPTTRQVAHPPARACHGDTLV